MPVRKPSVAVIDTDPTAQDTPPDPIPVDLEAVRNAIERDLATAGERIANIDNKLAEDPTFDRWEDLRALGADLVDQVAELAAAAKRLANHPGA